MENSKPTGWKKIATSILLFVAHQVGGTFGVAVFAYLVGISIFRFVALFGIAHSTRTLHHLLTELPYFPVQIAVGLWCGWGLARRFRHRAMKYVWILPFLSLTYAVFALPGGSTPEPVSVLDARQSRFSHYFGWGCQPKDHCLDQLVTTMPFYAALAYSFGAWLAFRTSREREGKQERGQAAVLGAS
jgi:hypothetical protein